MARLILFAALIAGLVVIVVTLARGLEALTTARPGSKGDTMPKTFQNIAYVLLIILMFGVVTGWLGAA